MLALAAGHQGLQVTTGQPSMQPGPLTGQQVGVDGLADQRVPERVALVAVGHQQLVSD